jgi:HTH-type transcriptional regulator/antitoxin HigA
VGQAKKIIEDLQKVSKLKTNKLADSYFELVEFFPLQPIANKKQHEAAIHITERLINALNEKADAGIQTYLSTLADLVTDYEEKMYDAPEVSGREMLAYLMELKGYTQMDVAKELGGQPNVSKILKGERELNLRQIRELSQKFKVEPAVFI